jgi:predicted RNA-binding Zn ribbon-like protein
VLPAEPLPVRLMNTIWAERGVVHDDLADREGFQAWLEATGMTSVSVTDRDAEAARDLRDSVRAAAAFVTRDQRPIALRAEGPESALEVINRHAAVAPTERLTLGGEGFARESPAAGDAIEALATIAAVSVQFLAGPGAVDLRACMAPRCVLYFVKDHPRRTWCDGACGDRARASRYYHRHRDDE